MKKYGNGIIKTILVLIVIASVIASGVLLVAYQANQPEPTTSTTTTTTETHTSDLPTAPLTIIIDSGAQGTQVVGNLEFGFLKSESNDYAVGMAEDWLEIHDGFNLTPVVGLGYTEINTYGFAYLNGVRLFDEWSTHISGASMGGDGVDWTPHSRSRMYTGGIPIVNRTDITSAGFVVEYQDLTIHFEGGLSYICGPTNLSIGVNFTRLGDDWQIEYIFVASSMTGVTFGSDSVTVLLDDEIPDYTETTTTTTSVTPIIIFTPALIPMLVTLVAALIAGIVWWKVKSTSG